MGYEMLEVPVLVKEAGEHMMKTYAKEKKKGTKTKRSGSSSRGSGDWPSTVARAP